MSKVMKKNELIDINTYDASKSMIFSEPNDNTIPLQGLQVSYKRINISTKNSDGSEGDLIIPTSGSLFCNKLTIFPSQREGGDPTYSIGMSLWEEGRPPNEDESTWINTYENIVQTCAEHIVDKQNSFGMRNLTEEGIMSDQNFDPVKWVYNDEKVIGANGKMKTISTKNKLISPKMYIKLIYFGKQKRFLTKLYNADNLEQEIDPNDLVDVSFNIDAAIKVESIFIGTKMLLQLKLYEGVVKILGPSRTGTTSLLRSKFLNKPKPIEIEKNSDKPLIEGDSSDSDNDISEEDIKKSTPVKPEPEPKPMLKTKLKTKPKE